MQQTDARIRPVAGLLIAGRYELVSELGRGGMGSVWAARDHAEPRSVAVKFQTAVVEGGSERRFAAEAETLCRLSCPHVVRFFYAGRDRGLSFIVMEHLLGHTLRRRLEMSGNLNPTQVTALIWQAAIGLGSAHRAGIVHRDVKPSNLFLTIEDGKECLKLIDFGIAKGRGLEASTAGSGAVGSPAYMSPEQALGERVDHRSDVWALAVVAFTALCGQEPFTAENVPATLDRICRGRARRITRERADLSPALDAFFARAFVHDPTHRFQSTSELAVHFERACKGIALEPLGRLSKTKSLAPSVPNRGLSPSRPAPSLERPPAPVYPVAESFPPAASYSRSSPATPIPITADRPSRRPRPDPVLVIPAASSRRPSPRPRVSERPSVASARPKPKALLVIVAAGVALTLMLLWAALGLPG
jgi:serine/threonine-protein kinase